jgi:hypothetical protein
MIINPPTDDPDEVAVTVGEDPSHEYVKWFMNVPSWKCSKCGLTNHGRNEKCADWRCRRERADERKNSQTDCG